MFVPLNVLVGCEFSGVVRDAFRALGHNAWSCDLLPTESPDRHHHFKCDVRRVLGYGKRADQPGRWDLLIAHPPCTRLCNSGVRWLHERNLWKEMEEAARFFRELLLDAPVPHIAVENPIMHKYAVEFIGRRQDQVVQPWWFGDGEIKATAWWLKNLPLLEKTVVSNGRRPRVHRAPPSEERWKDRSRFLPGMAKAMAEQWGAYVMHAKSAQEATP